jgi:hypothetical protein
MDPARPAASGKRRQRQREERHQPLPCARSHKVRLLEQSWGDPEAKEKWDDAVEALDRSLDCDPQNTASMMNAMEPLRRLGLGLCHLDSTAATWPFVARAQ